MAGQDSNPGALMKMLLFSAASFRQSLTRASHPHICGRWSFVEGLRILPIEFLTHSGTPSEFFPL